MTPKLRFHAADIPAIASRYPSSAREDALTALIPAVRNKGCLTRDGLAEAAYWKSPRSAGKIQNNAPEYVEEITGFALRAAEERSRIEILTLLDGVSWPTASVILHFFHQAPYPVLDYRALWSVSLLAPSRYCFGFWIRYVEFCRDLATARGLEMRTLDRALWQFSLENQ